MATRDNAQDEKSLDPKTEPWTKVVRVYYRDELILDIANREPNHPLVAVFRPVFTKNRDELKKEAAKYYNQIAESNLPADMRSKLEQIGLRECDNRGIKAIQPLKIRG